jgi:hypothetical protein
LQDNFARLALQLAVERRDALVQNLLAHTGKLTRNRACPVQADETAAHRAGVQRGERRLKNAGRPAEAGVQSEDADARESHVDMPLQPDG